ncbi:hypothetical protein HYC85_006316 [Camellia sinensis]|uniref:Uncharacterized protein n=1 Tax=Camellia sinensis TaxID=4442 RepID=A0A7J7HKN6_CAMSI|nr:hypothetical protein HYC85_006316 [Camellia sinensis]
MSVASAATSVTNHCRRRSSPPPLALRVTVDHLLLDCLIASLFENGSNPTMAIAATAAAHQQRLAAASQLMASIFPLYSAVAANKCINLLFNNSKVIPKGAVAALIMGEDMHKFRQFRLDRNEFPMNGGLEMVNPSSRQIYLTFPTDSIFRKEDVKT